MELAQYKNLFGADIYASKNINIKNKKNGMYLLVLSDQSVNTPTIFYNSRIYYHDN